MIVDDHEIVRRGIAEIIDRADGLDVVAEAGSKAEALRRAELVRPDVILVDLQLPDGTGIELMHELRESVPDAMPIVLTSFDDDDALAESLDAGARAYLLKTVHGAEISDVVRAVASGRVLLDDSTAAAFTALEWARAMTMVSRRVPDGAAAAAALTRVLIEVLRVAHPADLVWDLAGARLRAVDEQTAAHRPPGTAQEGTGSART